MPFIEKLETIPSSYRWAMIPGLLFLFALAYGYFVYQPWVEAMARYEEQRAEKQQILQKHRTIAAKYDTFKARVDRLDMELREALLQLPQQKEIPELIRQISDLGVRTGLQISLLRPQPELRKEYVAEVPITVSVRGPYHAVGQFFDALGRLPRIVNVSNVQMNAKTLETQCLATTFRFLEESEADINTPQEGGHGQRGRRKQ